MHREQLGRLDDRFLRKLALCKVGAGELDRVWVIRDVRGDGRQHEVLPGGVEGVRGNDQRGTSFRRSEVGEREGDQNDVACL